jgi:hypothetical protein
MAIPAFREHGVSNHVQLEFARDPQILGLRGKKTAIEEAINQEKSLLETQQVFQNIAFYNKSFYQLQQMYNTPMMKQLLEKVEELKQFICPITGNLIFVPVINKHGKTYEEAAITEWLPTGHKQENSLFEDLKLGRLGKIVFKIVYLIYKFFFRIILEGLISGSDNCKKNTIPRSIQNLEEARVLFQNGPLALQELRYDEIYFYRFTEVFKKAIALQQKQTQTAVHDYQEKLLEVQRDLLMRARIVFFECVDKHYVPEDDQVAYLKQIKQQFAVVSLKP